MRRYVACLILIAATATWPLRSQPLLTGGQANADPGLLCRGAVAVAEAEAGLPPRLLAAIARVESGRRDAAGGAINPWPWAVNAEGRGNFFPTREAAIAAVRHMQTQGVRSIDVGCLQINLRHHPNAFADLEQAFDPLANARYGARFLAELQATRGDWMRSASHYHSQTPDLAEAYRARLVVALAAEQDRSQPTAQRPLVPAAVPPLVPPAFAPGAGGGFLLSNRAERGAILPTQGGAGRGLDAYRTLPIPVAGRGPPPGLAQRL